MAWRIARIAVVVGIPVAISAAPMIVDGGWLLNSDGALYAALATSLRTGAGYTMPDGAFAGFRPPLLPAAFAAVWSLTGPSIEAAVALLRVFQLAVMVLGVAITWRIAGSWAAILAGLLLASTPALNAALGPVIRPDGMMTAFVLASVLLFVVACERGSVKTALAAGLLLGLGFAVKQSAAALVLVPVGSAVVLPWTVARLRVWLAFLATALPIPLAWMAVTSLVTAPGRPPLLVIAGTIGWAIVVVVLASLARSSEGARWRVDTAPSNDSGARPWPAVFTRALAGLAFAIGLVLVTALAVRDRVEIPSRGAADFPGMILLDADLVLATPWVAPFAAVATLVALGSRIIGPRIVAIALIASLPVAAVAWRYDLRDSQYALPAALATIMASALPWWMLSRSRGSGWTRVSVAASVGLVALVTVVIGIPKLSQTLEAYAVTSGADAPRYRAMVAASNWLARHAPAGAKIGYDEEPARQIFYELDGDFAMPMAPQVFVVPVEGRPSLPIESTAWVDIGQLGVEPPPIRLPILKLATQGGGRYFVALEEATFVEWLQDSGVSHLIVTAQPAFGLAWLTDYLAEQDATLVFEYPGNYWLRIYAIEADSVRPVESLMYTTPATLKRFAGGAGMTRSNLAHALNRNGWAVGRR